MVYEVYKFLIENEVSIIEDLNTLDSVDPYYLTHDNIKSYIEKVIQVHYPNLNPEQLASLNEESIIKKFIASIQTILLKEYYGNSNQIH